MMPESAAEPRPGAFHECRARINRVLEGEALDDGLISDILRAQRGAIPGVDALLSAIGVDDDAPWWSQAVPSGLYRHRTLYANVGQGDATRVFHSSGTTSGATPSKAPYSIDGLQLMDQVIHINAQTMLFPDNIPTRILVLAPPPSMAPQMIMAYGMQQLIDAFGLPGSRFMIGPKGLDPVELNSALTSAIESGTPLTLIGATFAFVHMMDTLVKQGKSYNLPPGSRLMHAGGFKGRSRVVEPGPLRQGLSDAFSINEPYILNLLGMTELASQVYEDGIAAHIEGRPPRQGKIPPPWMRTQVVDPITLDALPKGEKGLLCHLDLANLERPVAIRTQDLGYLTDHGFEILGRAEGAQAAGCSLSLEELLETAP